MRDEVRYQVLMPAARPSPLLSAVQFVAVLLVAATLAPFAAHLLEMPNKLALPPQEYMVVQQIYRGWALLGAMIIATLLVSLVHTLMLWRYRAGQMWALLSFLCLGAGQAVFWMYTYPVNVRTADWTRMPDPFDPARLEWEYSHALIAILNLAALCAVVMAVLWSRRLTSASDTKKAPAGEPVRSSRSPGAPQHSESA